MVTRMNGLSPAANDLDRSRQQSPHRKRLLRLAVQIAVLCALVVLSGSAYLGTYHWRILPDVSGSSSPPLRYPEWVYSAFLPAMQLDYWRAERRIRRYVQGEWRALESNIRLDIQWTGETVRTGPDSRYQVRCAPSPPPEFWPGDLFVHLSKPVPPGTPLYPSGRLRWSTQVMSRTAPGYFEFLRLETDPDNTPLPLPPPFEDDEAGGMVLYPWPKGTPCPDDAKATPPFADRDRLVAIYVTGSRGNSMVHKDVIHRCRLVLERAGAE